MGTSTDFKGSPNWGGVKAKTTQAASQGVITPQKAQRLVASFTKHLGRGGFGVSSSSGALPIRSGAGRGGRRGSRPGSARGVAANIAGFVSQVAKIGLQAALAARGVATLAGKSVEEIRLTLLAVLGTDGSTIEQVDLQQAFSELMDGALGDATNVDELERAMESLAQDIRGLITKLFGNYIYERFCSTMYAGLLTRLGADAAEKSLSQIQAYIHSSLELTGQSQDLRDVDWGGQEGALLVDGILQDTLEIFGGAEE